MVFAESAIFRVDHYLGKRPVNSILMFRFANSFMEPFWNRHYPVVSDPQVTTETERPQGISFAIVG